METTGGDGESQMSPLAKWRNDFSRAFQHHLDKSAPHMGYRWLGTLAAAAIYVYILNLLIGFLFPKVDPEIEALDGVSLPSKDSTEFRPFIRRLPEFKFWYAITKAFCVAFFMTFFSAFDVPVFWPILFLYWLFLFFLTMIITHMIKHRYVPFNIGKQRYDSPRSDGSTQ